jgi:hypothetical protein
MVGDVFKEEWRSMPTTMDGGGRDGVLVFPARGRRTWMEKARISIVGVRGCYCNT